MRNTTILPKYVVHANALTYFTFAVTYATICNLMSSLAGLSVLRSFLRRNVIAESIIDAHQGLTDCIQLFNVSCLHWFMIEHLNKNPTDKRSYFATSLSSRIRRSKEN